MLKRLLTSQLSMLDSLMICTIPAICTLCLYIRQLWITYTGGQNIEFIVYQGSNNEENDEEFMYRYSLLGQEYRDFRMELVDASGRKAYTMRYKSDPCKGSLIKEMIEVLFASSGLLAICLAGGLFGWFLT